MATADRAEEQEPPDQEELRVSTIELFFDLVFVFTLTQLTSLLAEHPTAENLARVVLIFVVLFWMYGGYVWLTNQVPPDRPARRLLMILGMAAFFMCALAIPEAFDGSGVALGIGYLLVILVHAGLWTQVYESRVVLRFGPFNVAAAVSVIIAGMLEGPAAYALWVAAIVILFVTPRIAGRAAPQFPVRSRHFVERHGLLLIVALGESVVAIGIGLAGVPLTLKLFGAGVLALALVAAMWWAYFVGDEEGADHAMTSASPAQRFGLAINGYFFAYIPILLGVITTAAGLELSIGDVLARLEIAPAVLLAGGVALYLTGDVAFRRVMRIRPIAYRAGAAVIALGTVVLGLYLAAAIQLVALVVIVIAALASEASRRRAERAAKTVVDRPGRRSH
ncbi:MAG: low temperature requirement protein A [Actinomycetota bacterium]